ncbi:MAG: 2-hydroxyacid dehydrogenase [Geminicoccaceae bacterium]
MAILFVSKLDGPDAWKAELTKHLPDEELRVYPEVGDERDIEFALAFQPPPGLLARLPNLRLIQSMGAGVDGIVSDPELPDVPLCRMVEPSLTSTMADYVLAAVGRVHRRFDRFAIAQSRREWAFEVPRRADQLAVGVLGLGELGGAVAERLRLNRYKVAGWSRTEKSLSGVETFYGERGLNAFLPSVEIVVALLPLTPSTDQLLNDRLFAAMPRGSHLINVGRGGLIDEEALLRALDDGQLAGATLDVFSHEPLPDDHPFWSRPEIFVTPHVSGFTLPDTAAPVAVENFRRCRAGESLLYLVDRAKGY